MVKTVLGLTHRKTYKIIQKSSFSEPKASDAWYFICSIAWKTSYKFFLKWRLRIQPAMQQEGFGLVNEILLKLRYR